MRSYKKEWTRLDNAAKIFPCNTNAWDTKVFWFVCQLKEPVDEDMLQKALEDTLEEFPIYKSILKGGFFWYYLERSSIKPLVHVEDSPPCGPLYDKNSKRLLFDVSYFGNRINLEVFHALTDGAGAMSFLKTLVCKYLYYKYPDQFSGGPPQINYDASAQQKNEDSFLKHISPSLKSKKKLSRAVQIKGAKLSEYRLGIIEGTVSTSKLLETARKYNTTITVLIGSLLIQAIYKEIPAINRKRPIVLTVPVNLRSYFGSETARNFFGIINVGYEFPNQEDSLETIIKTLNEKFKKQLTKEKIIESAGLYLAIERNPIVRFVPLAVKDIVLKIANKIADKQSTCTLSNIGRVVMPESTERFIDKFSVYNSTDRLGVWVCSYKDKLTISFTSVFKSTEIQKNFFRALANMGFEVEIATNPIGQ